MMKSMKLRTAILFCCIALLSAGVFLLPAFLEAKDAQEVELHFDGRPKVGETYVISVNSRQERTYRMKLVGINNPPRRRETHEIHAVGELVYQSLDPLVVQFKVESLFQIVDGVKTDYATLSGMTAIVRSSGGAGEQEESRRRERGEEKQDGCTQFHHTNSKSSMV